MPRTTRATRLPRLHPSNLHLRRAAQRRARMVQALQLCALCGAAALLLAALPLLPAALPLALAYAATLPPLAVVAMPAGACALLAWVAYR